MTTSRNNEEFEGRQKKPKLICVGTGRDGTLSVCHMIQDIFDRTDGRRAWHEYGSREFYQAFCEYVETGDEEFADQIRQLIRDCPFDCIVGNGYAAILPFFHEEWGADTMLVHIRRADREACITSLMRNCEMFPAAYRYYTSNESAFIKRMAAFHFGDMTREQWQRMPAAARFSWYYDKTHALIDQHRGLFAKSINIFTESLSDEHSRRAIARLATGTDTIVPPPARLHAHAFDIASFENDRRDKAMWLVGQIDWERLVTDDNYAIDYFLKKFSIWMDAQIRGVPVTGTRQSTSEMAANLVRARELLKAAIANIDDLETRNFQNRN